jgi:molybdopterin synthase sulfur carrier subunit
MARVWIPSLLRDLTDGQERLEVPGQTVRQVIEEMERRYPGMKGRLCAGDSLRSGIAVVINSQVAQLGLLQTVGPNSELHFLPALSGG